jgi:hypothetical protein
MPSALINGVWLLLNEEVFSALAVNTSSHRRSLERRQVQGKSEG